MSAPGSAARRPASGETSGSTVALPPPWVRALAALSPITATEPRLAGSHGSSPRFSSRTVPSTAACRAKAMPSSVQAGSAGGNPVSAPTRRASVRMRPTLRSTAASGTAPERTARTRASPQAPSGPGMTRSCAARAASSVRTAVQSLTTTPSKPHSLFNGVSSSSFPVMVVPLTELYELITSQARASVTAFSNASRYSSRSARSLTRTSTVKRSVSESLAT